MSRQRLRQATLIAALCFLPVSVFAHDIGVTDVLVVLKSDGSYLVDLTMHMDALALGVPADTPSELLAAELETMSAAEFELAIGRARDTLLRRLRLRFDGKAMEPELSFPAVLRDAPPVDGERSVLGMTARLSGRIPDGAMEFSFYGSLELGPSFITILDQQTTTGVQYLLLPGEESAPYPLSGQPVSLQPAGDGMSYLKMGFGQILPGGFEYILFVFGLSMLAARLGPLLWQVIAFTLAHAVTMGLSTYGVIALPSRIVGALIAASIVYLAVENVVVSEIKPWRPALVFGFGLFHGLGAGGILRELLLPKDHLTTALTGVNVGVGLGLLAVIGLGYLLVGWARDESWYRRNVVVPSSVLIVLVGSWWMIQHALLR